MPVKRGRTYPRQLGPFFYRDGLLAVASDRMVRAADLRQLAGGQRQLAQDHAPETEQQPVEDFALDERRHSEIMKGFASADDEKQPAIREVVALARKMGVSPAQVALASLRYRPVPVIPIIGARKLTQLEDNTGSLHVALSSGQVSRLDKSRAVFLGFPHDFLALGPVRSFVYGGQYDRIKAWSDVKTPPDASPAR